MRTSPLQLLLALGLLLVLAWAACGGGGQPGTPAGTYTVTLKALDTQANLSHSTTVTLTVN
jgi:ABC-type glycerol-3-phosphate transport system substrate-binding protein